MLNPVSDQINLDILEVRRWPQLTRVMYVISASPVTQHNPHDGSLRGGNGVFLLTDQTTSNQVTHMHAAMHELTCAMLFHRSSVTVFEPLNFLRYSTMPFLKRPPGREAFSISRMEAPYSRRRSQLNTGPDPEAAPLLRPRAGSAPLARDIRSRNVNRLEAEPASHVHRAPARVCMPT